VMRSRLLEVVLLLALAASPRTAARRTPQMFVQVVDVDSLSSLQNASVTRRAKGSSTDLKSRTTDGSGNAGFGPFPDGEFEVFACRPDYVPSGWTAWRRLDESDEIEGARVIKLKRTQKPREDCLYLDQGQTRPSPVGRTH
jgi:hypothetical protein